MSGEIAELEFTLKGRVQMVMFRDFAKRKAKSLKLNGFVKNNDDGSVVVLAQGAPSNLLQLEKHLKKGPIFAKVEEISKKERVVEKVYSDFEIVY